MDQRMIGKWYNVDRAETINTFDETPLRMKMSFETSGHFNFEPNCVYEKDGNLFYEINDEYYRMVYCVSFVDGCISGYYTQFGTRTEVRYYKTDDTPEDAPFRYEPTEIFVELSGKTRAELLNQCADYDRSFHLNVKDEFVLNGEVPEILEKYHYSDYVKGVDKSADDIVFRLLDFVCDHFGHNGSGGMGYGKMISDLISFMEGNNMKSNCRGLAILLASLLRLNGVKARHITCMPYEDPFNDCHVVVDCLLPSGKRVMLDPTWRLYLRDKDGEYVSLPRLREMLLSDEEIYANDKASYNGMGFDKDDHRAYMIKNTLRFARCTLHKEGVDGKTETSEYIELIPKDYPAGAFTKDRQKSFVYNDTEFWRM